MATLRGFADGCNKGDPKALVAACTKWLDEFDVDATKNGITNRVVTLGNPGHVEVTADRAKFVIPANCAFIQKGRPANETGSMNPPAMPKGAAGWRITGWAWSES